MAYGSETGVEALVPAVGAITGATVPNSTQVGLWIDEGAAQIDRVLGSAGYSVPVSASADCYEELRALNNLYAAAYVLRARGLDTMQGTDQNKTSMWLAEFRRQLAELAASNLVAGGASLATTTSAARRRVRSLQMRRIDGYSGKSETAESAYDYPSV